MQKKSPQIAETAAANARLTAVGALEDATKSWDFVSKKFGRAQVAVSSGYTSQSGMLGNKWVDRMDTSFQEVERVKIDELQDMSEGEFYFLFQGNLIKSATFYVGDVGRGGFGASFSVNKFVKVRGPTDRVPNLDQSVEINFIASYVQSVRTMREMSRGNLTEDLFEPESDSLARARAVATDLLWKAGKKASRPENIILAWSAGLAAAQLAQGEEDDDDDDDDMLDFDAIDYASEGEEAPPGPDEETYLPDEDVHEIGRRAATGIVKAATGETTSHRHEGMIDVLVAQKQAVDKASQISSTKKPMQAMAEREEQVQAHKRKSMEEFFRYVSKNSDRLAQIFAEEDIEGSLGISILQRTGTANLIPLADADDDDQMSASLAELEKIIKTG